MPNSALIIRDGSESHQLLITHRDWGLLYGPLFKEGPTFIHAFGIFDHYTIAGGIPKGSHVTRGARRLYSAAFALLHGIQRDEDLLRHDYWYAFDNERPRQARLQNIQVRGRDGFLSTWPKGYCSIELYDAVSKSKRIAEFIDLRIVCSVQTDGGGVVKIHPRKAPEIQWLQTLPPLLEFLKPRIPKELVVEHIDRAV